MMRYPIVITEAQIVDGQLVATSRTVGAVTYTDQPRPSRREKRRARKRRGKA